MTVILVLATFITFLLIDHFYSRRLAVRPVMEVQPQPATSTAAVAHAAALQPTVVAGFQVPENLKYHPGHTWALNEGPKMVRIGLDDFAARLLGKVQNITLPQRGQWVRQGQKIWTIERNGAKVDMVSPIEGVVTDVNDTAAKDPELARRDPYGDGWLVSVESPDAKLNFRNLLSGELARWWMDEAAARLRKHMPIPVGVAQDGGTAISDLTGLLGDKEWAEVTREFFLS
jgi:glycine cleavage system H lipoate-binding protein